MKNLETQTINSWESITSRVKEVEEKVSGIEDLDIEDHGQRK